VSDCLWCALLDLHTLTLHGTNTTMLRRVVNSKIPPEKGRDLKTHGKEDPLKHLAVVFWLFRHVEPKLVFWIVVLREVEQDGGCLEDREALRSGRGWSVPVH